MALKQTMLDVAEIVDAWRLFPRLFMAFYLGVLMDVHIWYKALPVQHWPDAYAAIAWGAAGVMFGLYINTGRKWVA